MSLDLIVRYSTILGVLLLVVGGFCEPVNGDLPPQMDEIVPPAGYVLESLTPKNNILVANSTYHILIWPKNAQGDNVTLAGSKLHIVARPQSYLVVC